MGMLCVAAAAGRRFFRGSPSRTVGWPKEVAVLAILTPLGAASTSSGGSGFSLLVLVAVMGGIFYFMLIRPQRRQRQRQATLINSVEVGDEVQTIGGMFGTVREIDDESVLLEVAPEVDIRFLRGAIARKLVYDEEEEYEEDEHQDKEHEEREAGEQK
jgi:preprotein translocase subunit YajC